MKHRGVGTAALLGLGAAAMAIMLMRRSLHGYDAFLALQATITGEGDSFGTLLYFPLARASWWLLRPIVPDARVALCVLSACGLGIAVAFAYLAARRLRLREPWHAALAVALLPAALYFGATVEVDALMLGLGGVAWWAAIPFVRRPGVLRAARLGAITGFAACLHGGGQLLLGAIMALAGMRALQRCAHQRAWRPLLRLFGGSAVTIAVHLGLYAVTAMLSGHEGQGVMAGNTLGLAPRWARLPTTLWEEWLLPYGPFALLWLLALLRPSLRWCAGGLVVVWCTYLYVNNAVSAQFEPGPPELWERGAFFVTIAAPIVLFGLAVFGPRLRRGVLLATLPIAVGFARYREWQPEPEGYAAAVQALDRQAPVWVLCAALQSDYGWIREGAGTVPVFGVWEIERELRLRDGSGLHVSDELLGTWFDGQYQRVRGDGRAMLITSAAMAALQQAADPRLQFLVGTHLPERYRLEPVRSGPFDAVRVERR